MDFDTAGLAAMMRARADECDANAEFDRMHGVNDHCWVIMALSYRQCAELVDEFGRGTPVSEIKNELVRRSLEKMFAGTEAESHFAKPAAAT